MAMRCDDNRVSFSFDLWLSESISVSSNLIAFDMFEFVF
ncbi:MAG: hypothetical protein P857_1010 [Candidatus Xenolissoclinum pacificiensis L6]|uniref:Uncharacterized protein n=1 Tax=Candidatus Xenolissoclinum pacificiensis L6 TaxID=1401685 RepID=W2V2F2_9RICK|nr:MAG: hypothetical protein P857_1010 [Candidatus Xenolissoclinum pacificiensis L6]